ncbi:hypothetical protein ACUY1T_03870 [Billgrantia sp. Q4P2]|uniref:hypothetical protein n=1 Tax=Billgrantia sp. Q4P2 TaxID=3463857 RepID=UPI004055BC04
MIAPYIEAFGCPAVGKSYVTERLLRLPEIRDAGIQTELFPITRSKRLWRVPRKLWLILSYLPALRLEWRRFVSLVGRTPWAGALAAGRALLNWLQLLSMLQRLHRQERPILLCQGIFQAIWSLRFRTRSSGGHLFPLQEWIALTVSLLPPRPIVVLHVVAETQAIHLRQRNRVGGQSVIDRQHEGQHDPARIVQEILEAIQLLEAQGKLRMVTFDNSAGNPTQETLAALAQTLGLGYQPPEALSQEHAAGLSEVP